MRFPNLESEMARRGCGVPELARRLGVSPGRAGALVRGEPTVLEAARIRDALCPELGLDELFRAEGGTKR